MPEGHTRGAPVTAETGSTYRKQTVDFWLTRLVDWRPFSLSFADGPLLSVCVCRNNALPTFAP